MVGSLPASGYDSERVIKTNPRQIRRGFSAGHASYSCCRCYLFAVLSRQVTLLLAQPVVVTATVMSPLAVIV
jgi:hypothetical protein